MVIKKTVLILVEHFGQGGAEKVAAMLADMLYESGKYNVHFYAVYDSRYSHSLNGIKKGTLGIKKTTGSAKKLLGYFHKITRLKNLKKELKIDLTISSLWPVDWINAFTGKEKKITIIQINILNNEQNRNMVRFKKIVSAVYKKFDRIVLGSANLEPEWTEFFKINKGLLKVIHNPIDVKLIRKNLQAPLPEILQPLFFKYNVMVVANRLHPVKNTTALIPIIKNLSQSQCVKLLVIGEGEEKFKLIELIKKEGLHFSDIENADFDEKASIYFIKFQVNIHNIISSAKMFLFPTKSEGLPLALLEAMYCGVPVIVSDCPNGGVSEAMNSKHPYLMDFPRHDPEFTGGGYLMPIPFPEQKESIQMWSDTIKEVLNLDVSKLELIKENNQNRASQFDKENIKLQWFDLIDEVLKSNEQNLHK